MRDEFISIEGVRVPRFLYGTAWKNEATGSLVESAIEAGFRGIDTANQRKHYHELGVGQGIASAIKRGIVTRQELFLQTKFTFRNGQDHRLPYDPNASIADQVEQSLVSSLEHLGTEFVDSLVLHGPSQRNGLGTADWEAWSAMETIQASGRVRLLGVSNVDADQLHQLCEDAQMRPRFVQNRCFARTGWDRTIRDYCRTNQIVYQGFSLLTANERMRSHIDLEQIAIRYGRSKEQIIFRFAIDMGMIPLTGTTDVLHMGQDLEVFSFQLSSEEIHRIEQLGLR